MDEQDPHHPAQPDEPPRRGSGSVPLQPLAVEQATAPVRLPPPGRPLDLSQDPDRVQPTGSVPVPPFRSGVPLDLSKDPDRVQPTGSGPAPPFRPGRPLDLSQDPDRVRPGPPGDRTLTDLLGDGAQEEKRDTYTWLAGLLAMLVFLALVAFVAGRLGPS